MAQANIKAVITAEDRASHVVQGFGGSIKGMASAVAIGTLAVQGITLAIRKFGEAGKFALDSASDFQQSRIAFETMLGSAAGAKKMLKEVSDFAQKTPFELPEVVTGAKQLLAYNIEAEKILPTFKALGNIAAGVGKDKLPQLILAFGQVKAATRLTGMELRQFTEAGVPMLATLAKQMGKTEAQIQDMVSEGQIGFPEVEKAIFGMSQEGGKFFNLMERQSGTFGGIMSNISDAFGRVAREVIGISETGDVKKGSIFYYLQMGAQNLLTWLNANKDGITAALNGIFGGLIGSVMWARQAFTDVTAWMSEKWNALLVFFSTSPFGKQLAGPIINAFQSIRSNVMPIMEQLRIFWVQNKDVIIFAAKAIGVGLIMAFGAVAQIVSGAVFALRLFLTMVNQVIGAIRGFNSFGLDIIKKVAGAVGLKPRAVGGPVSSNTPYLVGENGPELFIPSSSGSVMSNQRTKEALSTPQSGGTTIINISPNIGVYTGSNQEMRRLSQEIVTALKDVANSRNMTIQELMGA